MPLPKDNKKYTYQDYLTWSEEERYELLDGEPVMMSPSPSREHQRIAGEVYRQIANYLLEKPCQVFAAPFDVRLNANEADDLVFQPDILIVCDEKKLEDGKCCNGAPDMVIEVLSRSTAKMDRFHKLQRYLSFGVREYWIVAPHEKTIEVYRPDANSNNNLFAIYEGESAPVGIFDDLEINLALVFSE